MAFDPNDPAVRFKLDLLASAMPARSAVVYGDVYVVDGGYTRSCLDLGCERVLLIDALETPAWQRTRIEHPALDFYKGDFADPLFMASVREVFDVGVVYDVLLHQASLLGALHLMLDKVEQSVVIMQPMLKETGVPQSLVYLPGNPDPSLHPLLDDDPEYNLFDPARVEQTSWIWGMTPSFLTKALTGEGFTVEAETVGGELRNERWFMWGCRARRTQRPERHWSRFGKEAGLYQADW